MPPNPYLWKVWTRGFARAGAKRAPRRLGRNSDQLPSAFATGMMHPSAGRASMVDWCSALGGEFCKQRMNLRANGQ